MATPTKIYNIALRKGVDYDAFWNEIEGRGSASRWIPDRAVEIAYARESSLRQCWYYLTDAEADELRNDPRIEIIEIPPEFNDEVVKRTHATQTGFYNKSATLDTSTVNWGLTRLNSATNNTVFQSNTFTYDYPVDGSGVDVVIMDGGVQVDHPEFQDANGVSRVQQIDWFAASGVSGTMPAFSDFYADYVGHGTHVCGIAAGKTYGRAKNSRIYVMTIDGLTTSPGVGISDSYAFDCIKGWHLNKPIDPATGYRRPTVVNMSWGYQSSFSNADTVTYRGRTYFTPGAQYGMVGYDSYYGTRVGSVDIDVQELMDAGVIVVGSAGNFYQTIDVFGGTDYNNYFSTIFGLSRYYMRGSSPTAADQVICVGAVSVTAISGEYKLNFSDSGPRVDIWAPGENIVSSMSTTNVYPALSGSYPANTNYKVGLLSGTSQSSPQVCGILAQMLQVWPNANQTQIRQKLLNVSTPDIMYTTGQTTDYSNSSSLHGAPNRYAYQPFNTGMNGSTSGPISIRNTSVGM